MNRVFDSSAWWKICSWEWRCNLGNSSRLIESWRLDWVRRRTLILCNNKIIVNKYFDICANLDDVNLIVQQHVEHVSGCCSVACPHNKSTTPPPTIVTTIILISLQPRWRWWWWWCEPMKNKRSHYSKVQHPNQFCKYETRIKLNYSTLSLLPPASDATKDLVISQLYFYAASKSSLFLINHLI